MEIIHERSLVEYDRITNTIQREVDALYGRGQENLIELLIETHKEFQLQQNVQLDIFPMDEDSHLFSDDLVSWTTFGYVDSLDAESKDVLNIDGRLITHYENFEVNITFDITNNILELRQIQQLLLILFILFSLVAATVLYGVLNKIFKPLELVAGSTEKIAKGDYSERIQIKGTDELALVTDNFNQMAEEIDNHITYLKDEADRKQQFIDNLAHELRTPLTSIYGYAEYMQKASLTEPEKLESTRFIMEEAGHMRKITNSMLELAKLRDYEPELKEINIAELFNQVKSSIEMTFQKRGVIFIIEPIEGYIVGQEDLIRSLISNLCINAGKACTANVGRVVLKAITTTYGVEITVSDNGCGIADQYIAKLTEPFFQVDTVRNKRIAGIGLGLAIVKQIADIHGAELIIDSEIDVGTEVKIIFTTS